jgi:hypothetical protein
MIWNLTQLSSVFISYYAAIKRDIAKYKKKNNFIADDPNPLNTPLLVKTDQKEED